MTLTSLIVPTLLAAILPAPMEASHKNSANHIPPAPETRDAGSRCEMKEAKLVLLAPKVSKPRDANFRPGETELCLYYLGKR